MLRGQVMAQLMAIDVVKITAKDPGSTWAAPDGSQPGIPTRILAGQDIDPARILTEVHTVGRSYGFRSIRPGIIIARAGGGIINIVGTIHIPGEPQLSIGRLLIEVVNRIGAGVGEQGVTDVRGRTANRCIAKVDHQRQSLLLATHDRGSGRGDRSQTRAPGGCHNHFRAMRSALNSHDGPRVGMHCVGV